MNKELIKEALEIGLLYVISDGYTRYQDENALTAAKMTAVPAGQQAWQAPTLLNGWTNYDATTWDPVGYMKDSLGFVHLRGFVKGGTISTGTIVFKLPVGLS